MMEDPFLGDPFLDDLDLFYEGLLSEEDARRLYQNGEITHEQLASYLEKKRKAGHQQAQNQFNPWVITGVFLLIFILCLIVSIASL